MWKYVTITILKIRYQKLGKKSFLKMFDRKLSPWLIEQIHLITFSFSFTIKYCYNLFTVFGCRLSTMFWPPQSMYVVDQKVQFVFRIFSPFPMFPLAWFLHKQVIDISVVAISWSQHAQAFFLLFGLLHVIYMSRLSHCKNIT